MCKQLLHKEKTLSAAPLFSKGLAQEMIHTFDLALDALYDGTLLFIRAWNQHWDYAGLFRHSFKPGIFFFPF